MGEDRPRRRSQGRAGLIALRPVSGLDPAIGPLAEAAGHEGFAFVHRLVDEWRTGTNRFDQPGEILLGAFTDGRLLGIGGLNRDPYASDARTGRVRHVYVVPQARRSGVGQVLVERIVAEAFRSFERVRLRTMTAEGAAFYAALGFVETDEPDATHRLPARTAG